MGEEKIILLILFELINMKLLLKSIGKKTLKDLKVSKNHDKMDIILINF